MTWCVRKGFFFDRTIKGLENDPSCYLLNPKSAYAEKEDVFSCKLKRSFLL